MNTKKTLNKGFKEVIVMLRPVCGRSISETLRKGRSG
jgi:hypothetical protein